MFMIVDCHLEDFKFAKCLFIPVFWNKNYCCNEMLSYFFLLPLLIYIYLYKYLYILHIYNIYVYVYIVCMCKYIALFLTGIIFSPSIFNRAFS